jgi:hypothetical protein
VFGEATRAIVDPKRSFALVPHSLIPTPFANALDIETENLRRSSYRPFEGRAESVIAESLHIKPMFNIRCHNTASSWPSCTSYRLRQVALLDRSLSLVESGLRRADAVSRS